MKLNLRTRELAVLLEDIPIDTGGIPVVHNVDTLTHDDAGAIRSALVAQLWQPVRWAASVQAMMGLGAGRFAECGPGKVLAGLNRRISREIESTALVSSEALTTAVQNWS